MGRISSCPLAFSEKSTSSEAFAFEDLIPSTIAGINSGEVRGKRIKKNKQLKEHLTPIPALLVCIAGKAEFNNVKEERQTLLPGDYVHIEPNVMHWVDGLEDSQLILVK